MTFPCIPPFQPFIALDVEAEEDFVRKKVLKYAYGSMQSTKSLIQLDWQMYCIIKRMATGKMVLDQPWELIES